MATKDPPHPSLIEDLGGGKNSTDEALSRLLREAAHYGSLTLAARPAKSRGGGGGSEALPEFPPAILEAKISSELTEIVFTGHGIKSLPTNRLNVLTRVCHLDLEKNNLGSGGGGGGAAMNPPLFVALLNLETLVSLRVRFNGLLSADLSPLLTVAPTTKWKRLEEIDLSNNQIETLPAKTVLCRTPKLRICLLHHNHIAGEISDEVPLLFYLPSLTTADFSHNKLTSFGQLRFMKQLST